MYALGWCCSAHEARDRLSAPPRPNPTNILSLDSARLTLPGRLGSGGPDDKETEGTNESSSFTCERPAESCGKNPPAQPADLQFPVVGIGASAGGLEACTALLKALPVNPGMAFVLVQHLDPHHESILHKLLSKNNGDARHPG